MEHIVTTRLARRGIPLGIIRRTALLNKINENVKKNLILICAPAGYGKTTIVQDFVAQNKYAHSWLHVYSDMDNFYTFIIYLINSIQKINKEFGSGTITLIEDYRSRLQLTKNLKRIVNDVTTAFVNEFSKHFSQEVTIVIDDLGNIGSSDWQSETFNMLFEKIPPNMHLIITSREVPKFTLSVLQAKRNLLKIEAKDLAFGYNEIEELVKNSYKIDCSEDDINVLKNNLSGWITGIHLILQSYGSEFPKLRLDKIIILEDIFNYFSEDILNNLDDETREFLLFTSLLESFTSDLCLNIFENKDCKKIIGDLLEKNIFIRVNQQSDSDSDPTYSYHLLFKNFLYSKLTEGKNQNQIKGFLKKVFAYYLKKKNHLSAITYGLHCGDTTKAIELIHNNFQTYFEDGNFESIWVWFEKIDDGLINKDSKLLYYKSLMIKYYKGDMEGSIPYIDKAIKLEKDNEYLVKYYTSKSRSLISLGKINEAIKNLKEVVNKKTSDENKVKLSFLTAYAYYQNTEYDKAIPLLDEAVKLLESSELSVEAKDIKLDIFTIYGHIYLIRGDYSKSISYYEQAAKKTTQPIKRFEAFCNLVLLYSQSGRFEKALNYLNEAREIAEKISIPIFKITYLLSSQALRFEFGDYEANIKLLEEMNKIAMEINHKYYIYLSYSLIGDSYYYLNKLSKAEEYYDLAFKYVNEESEFEKIQYSVMKAGLVKKEKITPEIEKVLVKAYDYYDSYKLIYTKTQAGFQLADYYLKAGNHQTSLTYLTQALNVSHEKEYISFLQRDFDDFRYLFDFAIVNNIQKDFIKTLTSLSIEKANNKWISPESKKRFEIAAQRTYDISLNTFGKGEIFVRGKLIDEHQWSKKKWKIIFVYLLLSPKKELTKDKIIDVFYPDTAADSADNIFHQLVSKFRNLIKVEHLKHPVKKSKVKKGAPEPAIIAPLVIYEDKLLKINNDFNFYNDSAEFESLYKISAIEKNPGQRLNYLAKAIELYKGNFLEGNYETWCEELRSKYLSYFISMSEGLIPLLFDGKQHESVLNYAENLLRYDNLNLTAYEYLIKSYENLDKHKIARETYSRLIKAYQAEFGEKPPESFTSKLAAFIS